MVVLLGSCALATAYLLARALGLRRAAEVALGTWCVGCWLVLAPVHALGLAGILRRGSLVGATLGLCAAGLAVALAARGPRGVRDDLRALLPGRSALAALAPRSMAWPLAVACIAVIAHAIVAGVLLPSEAWDGVWYHETLVGWTIQSGSYEPMPLPDNLVQQANGFPRNGEMLAVWLAMLADRRLVELPNTLALVPLLLATQLIAARFVRQRALAWALACAVALAPGAILQLRSTYVDVLAAAAALTALHFATKRPLAARDVALAGLAGGLSLGTKISALLLVPLIAAVLAIRAARELRGAPRAWSAALAGGALLASSAIVYLRNFVLFANPFYPIAIDAPRLGVRWPGVRSSADVDVNATLSDTLGSIFLPAASGRDFADIRRGGYGLAVAWIVLPLAAAGVARAALAARSRSLSRGERARQARARWLLAIVLLVAPSALLSPALWSARYNLHLIAVAAAAAAYALDGLRVRAARIAIMVGVLVLSLVATARFDPPLGDAPLARLVSAWRLSAEERATSTSAPWTIAPHVARAREAELGPGAVVVFGPGVTFPSLLYNERFDDTLVYLADVDPDAIDARVRELRPTWIVASPAEPLHRYASDRPSTWEVIGLASRGQPTYAFRRVGRDPDAEHE